jgi:predicted secreted protein
VAQHFQIERKLLEDDERIISKSQKEQLRLVSQHFLEQSEVYFRTTSDDPTKPYLHFWLRTRTKAVPYKPVLMTRELRLSEKDYCELTEIVQTFLAKTRVNNQDNTKLKNFTVAFLMCEGGAVSGKASITPT